MLHNFVLQVMKDKLRSSMALLPGPAEEAVVEEEAAAVVVDVAGPDQVQLQAH